MMLRTLLLSAVPLALAGAACLPVTGERIRAQDMAKAIPAFGALPAELSLGYAPASGSSRTYGTAELMRLARRYGLAEPAGEVCFVQPLRTLTPEVVAAALRAVLPAAGIEVVDFSRQPVPDGDVRFSLSGLARPSSADPTALLMWRGEAGPPGNGCLPVWAKVRIRLHGTRVVAAETLEPGRRIERAQVELQAYEGPPGWPELAQVLGRAVRRQIPAGTVLEERLLAEAQDVLSGERVRVEVSCGRARLLLEGQAQASGKRGETIAVRNPSTGKVFRARIQAPGVVSVAAAWPVEGEH